MVLFRLWDIVLGVFSRDTKFIIIITMLNLMVRTGIPEKRAKRGIIPSDPFKDRARTVHHLIKTFESRFGESEIESIAKTAKEILEVGDVDLIFSDKDPYVSGVAIFVYLQRKFSPYSGITYNDIREQVAHFSSGANFVGMLNKLQKRFG